LTKTPANFILDLVESNPGISYTRLVGLAVSFYNQSDRFVVDWSAQVADLVKRGKIIELEYWVPSSHGVKSLYFAVGTLIQIHQGG
jgi:hypothetical protein